MNVDFASKRRHLRHLISMFGDIAGAGDGEESVMSGFVISVGSSLSGLERSRASTLSLRSSLSVRVRVRFRSNV